MDERDFDPEVTRMEYHLGSFAGLKDAVDNKLDEQVIVDGVTYYVSKIVGAVDGKNFIADLIEVASN
jgi:hypothetical protein